MTLGQHCCEARIPTRLRARRGFTLAELLVAMSVTVLVMAGIIGSYLFGLKLYEFTRPKLIASDHVRNTVGHLLTEVRSARSVVVGQGTFSSFTPIDDGSLQQGNAIKIVPASATNTYCIYYRDPADRSLKRATNGATQPFVMARSVSNEVVFAAESFDGSIQTNNSASRVIAVQLQLQQTNYMTKVTGQPFYDFYEVRTKITKRTL